jgi:hypothetical protein
LKPLGCLRPKSCTSEASPTSSRSSWNASTSAAVRESYRPLILWSSTSPDPGPDFLELGTSASTLSRTLWANERLPNNRSVRQPSGKQRRSSAEPGASGTGEVGLNRTVTKRYSLAVWIAYG